MAKLPAPRLPDSHGRALERLLAAPDLAQVVPSLQPETLHRVIQHCGLEDCGALVALATPDQLSRVFDLDLWRPPSPGFDDAFDGDRFGLWLEVMAEADLPRAAALLAAMNVDVVAAGFLQHVRVFDYAAVAPFTTLDGEEASPGWWLEDVPRCEVGGFVVAATHHEFWDAVTTVLHAMADAHGDAFGRVMQRCRSLSHSRPEVDGLDDLLTAGDQAMFDLGLDREARRDVSGYVTPAQARAFLQESRHADRHGITPPPLDPITRAYFTGIDERLASTEAEAPAEIPAADHLGPATDAPPAAFDAIVDLLEEAGAMPQPPRALLEGPQTGGARLERIRTCLQFALERDPHAYAKRSAELAYLANVIVAGATIQSRPVPADEASSAAVAVCNLGLENWPTVPADFLIRHSLVGVFQIGLTVLHEDVCMYAAEKLVSVLASLRSRDDELQAGLDALRTSLTKHWRAGSPWDGRDALDVIALFDAPSWAALLGLIDRFPTLHAAVGASLSGSARRIDPAAFDFISEPAQIQQVRDLMEALPGRLRG